MNVHQHKHNILLNECFVWLRHSCCCCLSLFIISLDFRVKQEQRVFNRTKIEEKKKQKQKRYFVSWYACHLCFVLFNCRVFVRTSGKLFLKRLISGFIVVAQPKPKDEMLSIHDFSSWFLYVCSCCCCYLIYFFFRTTNDMKHITKLKRKKTFTEIQNQLEIHMHIT